MNDDILSVRAQRHFIHDLSSPLTVAMGMVDSSLRTVKTLDPVGTEKLEKARNALAKLAELLRARREILVKATPQD